jgi:uncharacterized membrane protein YfcA
LLFAFLFLVALLGGALNAVGGGATFLVFPALVFAGVAPLEANVTASVALWPASIVTAFVYRRNLAAPKGRVAVLAAASAVGAATGSLLLLRTPSSAFTHLVPYLLLLATLVFTFGEPLAKGLVRRRAAAGASPGSGAALVLVVVLQVIVGVYGGYFGAGMGILMLAQLSFLSLGDMHAVNAVRSILTMVINAVCVVIFVSASAVAWRHGFVMMLGAMTGGYAGATVVRGVDARHVRVIIVVVAWLMTAYFFFARGR